MIFKKKKEGLSDTAISVLNILIGEVKDLRTTIESELTEFKNTKLETLNQNIDKLTSQLGLEQAKVFEAEERIEILYKKYISACHAKGGLVKHNNQLVKDYENLKQEFENYKNNSYSKTILPAEELPKPEPMRLKRSGAKGEAKRILKQKNERDYKSE